MYQKHVVKVSHGVTLYRTSFGWFNISFSSTFLILPYTFLRWSRTFGVSYKPWRLGRSNQKRLAFCKTFKGTVSEISYSALLCHHRQTLIRIEDKDWKWVKPCTTQVLSSWFVTHSQTHLFISGLQVFPPTCFITCRSAPPIGEGK